MGSKSGREKISKHSSRLIGSLHTDETAHMR
jgi:hypothetical protein